MLMSNGVNNNRFKDIANNSLYNQSGIANAMNTEGSSLNQIYNSALSDIETTTDEVDRTTGDSGSSSSAEKTAMWTSIATAVISSAAPLITAIGSFGKGSGEGNGGVAATGDPLVDLTNKGKLSKKDRADLQLAAENAQKKIETNTLEIKDIGKEIDKVDGALKTDDETKALFNDTIAAAHTQMETDLKNYDLAVAQENAANTQIQELKDRSAQTLSKIDESRTEGKDLENKKTIAEMTFEEIEKSEADAQTKHDAYETKYAMALEERPGLEQAVQTKTGELSRLDSEVSSKETRLSSLKRQKSDLEKIKGKDATATASAARDPQISQIQGEIDKLNGSKDTEGSIKHAEDKRETAKKEKEEAESALNKNTKLIADLKGALGESATHIEELFENKTQAANSKKQIEASLEANVATVEGLIDENKLYVDAQGEQLEISELNAVEKAKCLTSKDEANADIEALTAALNNDECKQKAEAYKKDLEARKDALTRENTTLQTKVDAAYKKLGFEKTPELAQEVKNGVISDYNKKDETTPTQSANTDPYGLNAMQKENEIIDKALEMNYSGSLNGVTKIEKDGKNFVITVNGKEQYVDKNGKPAVPSAVSTKAGDAKVTINKDGTYTYKDKNGNKITVDAKGTEKTKEKPTVSADNGEKPEAPTMPDVVSQAKNSGATVIQSGENWLVTKDGVTKTYDKDGKEISTTPAT